MPLLRQSRTLARALFTNQVLLVVISALLFSPIGYAILMAQLERQAADNNRLRASVVASQATSFLQTAELLLRTLDPPDRDSQPPWAHLTEEMDDLIARTGLFDTIYLLGRDNHTLTVGLPETRRGQRTDLTGISIARRGFVDLARATDQPQWSDSFVDLSGEISVALALPLPGEEVLIGHFSLARLHAFIAGLDMPDGTLALILDRHGQLIAAPRIRSVRAQENHTDAPLVRAALEGREETGLFVREGRDYLASTRKVPGIDWILLVATPRDKILGQLRNTFALLVAGALLAILLAALISRLLARELARPFVIFNKAAKRLADGNFDVELPRSALGEIQQLSDSLATMASRLRDQMEFLRTMLDTLPMPVYYTDRRGLCLGCNRAFEHFFAVSRSEMLGQAPDHPALPERLRFLACEGNELLATGGSRSSDHYLNQGAQVRFVTLEQRTFNDRHGRVGGLVGVLYDLTDRFEAERENRQLRRYLDNIIDAMPSVLFTLSRDLHLIQLNRACRKRLEEAGTEAPELEDLLALFGIERGWIEDAMGENHPLSLRRTSSDGDERTEDITIYPLDAEVGGGAVLRIDDVTEQVRMERAVVQGEKLRSVAGLAAGMAHEINNPLAGIVQTTQLIRMRLDPRLPANWRVAERCACDLEQLSRYLEARSIPELLQAVEESGQRAGEIVRNMLEFSRRDERCLRPASPRELIEKSLQLAANDYDLRRNWDFRAITIHREMERTAPVLCVPGQLQQVFYNLIRNAAQAMAAAGTEHPTLRIRLKDLGDLVRFEFEDNGPGIAPELYHRIFEPFFTTKDAGSGTGLGLSVAYFIITENHGGQIEVRSEPGKGCCFVIDLPGAPDGSATEEQTEGRDGGPSRT